MDSIEAEAPEAMAQPMLRRLYGRSYLGHGYIGGLKGCQFVY